MPVELFFAFNNLLEKRLWIAYCLLQSVTASVAPWAVPVRAGFVPLVLSRACHPTIAWRLRRGARVSPFQQNILLQKVDTWKARWHARFADLRDLLTLPFALWGHF